MVSRRSLLQRCAAGTGTLVAGCLKTPTTEEPANRTSRQSRSDTTEEPADSTSNVQRRVTLVEQDSVPQEYDARLSVEMVRSIVTPERTARLRVTTTNTGVNRVFSFSEGRRCSLFNRSRGGSDSPRGLWLYSPSNAEVLERKGDRWVVDAPPTKRRAYPAYGCEGDALAKNASFSNEYLVWDDFQEEGYMTPGVYRFEEGVTISPRFRDPGETREPSTTPRPTVDPRRIRFTWGFSLKVSR